MSPITILMLVFTAATVGILGFGLVKLGLTPAAFLARRASRNLVLHRGAVAALRAACEQAASTGDRAAFDRFVHHFRIHADGLRALDAGAAIGDTPRFGTSVAMKDAA